MKWLIGGGLVFGVVAGGYLAHRLSRRAFADAALELEQEFGGPEDADGDFENTGDNTNAENTGLVVLDNTPGLRQVGFNTIGNFGGGVRVGLAGGSGPSLAPQPQSLVIRRDTYVEDPDDGGDGLGRKRSNVITDQQAAENNLIVVRDWTDLKRIASAFIIQAEARKAQKEGRSVVMPPEVEAMLKNIKKRAVWASQQHAEQYLSGMARELEKIGGYTTDGWHPNTGTFGSSNNEFTMPRKSADEWKQMLSRYSPADYAIEVAVLLYADMVFTGVQGGARADTLKVLEDGYNLAKKYVNAGTSGAGEGGPVGAILSVVTAAIKDLIKVLEKAAKRPPEVHNKQDELVNRLRQLALEHGLVFPFVEMELYMVTGQRNRLPGPLSTGGYRAFPRHLAVWCQNAVHDAGLVQIYEGVYPGPALAAHLTINSTKKFACTDTDGNNIMAKWWQLAPVK